MNSLLLSLPKLLPAAYDFVEKEEAIVLNEGDPLTESELADARRAGVVAPENIRVMRVENLPEPEYEEVMFAAKRAGLFSQQSTGLALGHGIVLRSGFWFDRYALVHECVHVAQYERFKGIRPFLDLYLRECIDPGHPFGGLEQEAIRVAKDICKDEAPKPPE
jgi:hypothetical protein